MSSDNEVQVKIVGDASQVAPAVEQTKGEIEGLGAAISQMNSMFSELGSEIKASMGLGTSSAKSMQGAMEGVHGAIEEASSGLTGYIMKVHEAAESVRTFQMRAKEFAELYVSMFAVERVSEFIEAMGEAAESVQHLSQTFGMTTGQVQQMQGVALGVGVSFETLARGMQILDKNAATTGTTSQSMAKALKAVGIAANDGQTQLQRLMTVADKFKTMADGPTKVALAMELFGRSGAQMIPVLNEGSQGIQALIDKTEQYGVVNEDATEKGLQLAETVNDAKVAWLGLETTLMDALAPALDELVQKFNDFASTLVTSYEDGGTVKQMFDEMKQVGSDLGGIMEGLSPIFRTLAKNVQSVVTAIEALTVALGVRYVASITLAVVRSEAVATALFAIEAVAGGAATAMEALGFAAGAAGAAMLAAVGGPVAIAIAALTALLYEAITGTKKATEATGEYAQAQQNAKESADQTKIAIDDLATAHGKAREKCEEEVKAHIANAQAKLKDAEASAILAQAELDRAQASSSHDNALINQTMMTGPDKVVIAGSNFIDANNRVVDQAKTNFAAAQAAVESLKQQIIDLQNALKAPESSDTGSGLDLSDNKAKKQKDTIVQQLQAELEAKKMTWDMEQDQQDTAQQYSLASEKAFWAQALEMQGLSATDREAIEKKYLAASSAIREQEISGQIDQYRKEEEEAGKSADAKLAIVKQETAYIGREYGLQSDQYKAALDREAEAQRQASDQKLAYAQQTAQNIEKLDQLRIAGEQQDDDFLVQMGLKSQQQRLADEITFQNELYQAEMSGLQKRKLAMEADPGHDPVAYAALCGQIAELEQSHQNKLNQIEQQAELQRTAIQRQAINELSTSWGQAIGKMITLQQGFAATIKSLWQGLQQSIGDAIAQILEQWLEKQLDTLILGGAASKASGEAAISTQAAIAGAGGVASMAAAPWPIDMGAPAFGAAMSATAMGFTGMLALPMFDTGAWNLSEDQIAMVHAGEMIIPADVAGGWRNAMSMMATMPRWSTPSFGGYGVAANSNAPAGTSGAGRRQQVFNGPVIMGDLRAIDTQSGADFLMRNSRHVAAAGDQAVRNGYRSRNA